MIRALHAPSNRTSRAMCALITRRLARIFLKLAHGAVNARSIASIGLDLSRGARFAFLLAELVLVLTREACVAETTRSWWSQSL